MKFDVVMANPPYKIAGDATIWCKFLATCIEIGADQTSMIVPVSILFGEKQDERQLLVDNGLHSYRILPAETFKGANVDTVLITCKKGYTGTVYLIAAGSKKTKIPRTADAVYNTGNTKHDALLSNLQKVMKLCNKFPKLGTSKLMKPDEDLPDTEFKNSVGVLYGVKNQNEGTYRYIKDVTDIQTEQHQLAFKYSPTHAGSKFKTVTFSYEQPFYIPLLHASAGPFYKYLVLSSEQECTEVIEYLKSPLVSFILLQTRSTTQSRDNPVFNNIPFLRTEKELRILLDIDDTLYKSITDCVDDIRTAKK